MRRLLLTYSIAILLIACCTLSCVAQSFARLDNIKITELKNSIDILLSSNDNINYNIINYMDGDAGVSLQDTLLGAALQAHRELKISQQSAIESAQLFQQSPSEIVIKLSGTDLKDKEIKVRNDVKKSNIILIEPEQASVKVASVPVMGETITLPDFSNFEVSSKISSKTPETHQPISMFSIEEDKSHKPQSKQLIAQARNYQDDASVLDLGNALFKKEEKDQTEQKGQTKQQPETAPAANPDSAINEPPPKDIDPESQAKSDLAKDIIGIDTEESVVEPSVEAETPAKVPSTEPGIFAKAWNFLTSYWVWFVVAGGCLIIGFIVLIVVGSVMSQQNIQAQGAVQTDSPQDVAQQPVRDKIPSIVDDDPVKFVAPANHKNSQSISEAINHIISVRDMTGR